MVGGPLASSPRRGKPFPLGSRPPLPLLKRNLCRTGRHLMADPKISLRAALAEAKEIKEMQEEVGNRFKFVSEESEKVSPRGPRGPTGPEVRAEAARSANMKKKNGMDSDQSSDCNLLRIKEKLNLGKIKLWLTPYYSEKEGINENEMKDLARACCSQLSIPFDACLDCLHRLQRRALDNASEQSAYRSTGVAALKVRVPEGGVGRALTVGLELGKSGAALKEAIGAEISVPADRLKVIFDGRLLRDGESLEGQGVRHGLHLMAVVMGAGPSEVAEHEEHAKAVDSMKEDVKLLAEDELDKDYLQVADQSGKLLKLPKKEKIALILAMTLHEKGRAAMKREDFGLALVLLLEAEKEFSYCNSSLLKSVDNYGLLNLDIVWCYLNLQSVTQLPDAEQRLRQCEASFQQSYGHNLERLIALKGSAGNENALFMRLHLLQAIVLYHQNKFNQSRDLLERVEQELKSLEVDDLQLSHLVDLGYGAAEARLALRQSDGDLKNAVAIIENKRQERKKNEEAEKKERELKRQKKKLGKCVNGEWIEPEFHKALMSMGYSYEAARWALAQTGNSICNGIDLIQRHPEFLPESEHVSDHSIAQISSLGFEAEIAKAALKKHRGDIDKAIEELVVNGGTLLDCSDSNESSSSSENSLPSTSQKHEEAYSRVSEGISNCAEDHLDLSLKAEKSFLQKYKDLLSKW